MTEPQPLEALAAWPVGPVLGLEPAGGTAGRTWKVTTSGGRYFLRLRGARTSSPARLVFDHGLRAHLAAAGMPTVAPLPGPAGRTWLEMPAGLFELYPWVEGRALVPGRPAEVAAAAQALARFHLAARSFRPAEAATEAIGQYVALGLDRGTSPRLDDPELQRRNLLALKETVVGVDDQRLLDRCLSRVEALCREYGGQAYARLSDDWVGHGDYTPANLLFDDRGQVVGIFDLDWALPGPRCRDVADGLYFFAAARDRIDSSSIWSLTEAVDLDREQCRTFLAAYQQVAPLTDLELAALPAAFAGRWLSIRLEGMAKVEVVDRFRFFARQIERPLIWLDRHWPALADWISDAERKG